MDNINNSLKDAILREVRIQIPEAMIMDDNTLTLWLFRQHSSLRLTFKGFIILKKMFTAYSFGIDGTLKSRHLAGMSTMEYPYYLTGSRLILFSETDAMVIKLSGGVLNFLETCSQIEKNDR